MVNNFADELDSPFDVYFFSDWGHKTKTSTRCPNVNELQSKQLESNDSTAKRKEDERKKY